MNHVSKWLFLLFFISSFAFSDDLKSKVIQLHYLQADKVVELITPLLNDNEKVSGSGQTLVIKASYDTIGQIRAVLHKIDVPPVTFDVAVYQGDPNLLSAQNKNTVTYSTTPRSENVRSQSVKVINGGSAVISTNEEVPVVSSVGIGWVTGINYQQHNIKNGFMVQPLLQGSQVKLTIRKLREQANPAGDQQFDNQQVSTTVMVPLNKWVLLGSAENAQPIDNNSVISSAGRPFTQNSSLYIKLSIVNSMPVESIPSTTNF